MVVKADKQSVETIIRVRAAGVPQRWRIGRCFTHEPTDIPAGVLNQAQLDRLDADRYLSVERLVK